MPFQTNEGDAESSVCSGAALVADVASVERRVGFHLGDGIVEMPASVFHLAVRLSAVAFGRILRHVGTESLFNLFPFLFGGIELHAMKRREVVRLQLFASDEGFGDSALVNHLSLEDVADAHPALGMDASRCDDAKNQ